MRDNRSSDSRRAGIPPALVALVVLAWAASLGRGAEDLERRATWEPPAPDEVRKQVLEMVGAMEVAPQTAVRVQALWPEAAAPPQGAELLEHLAATVALVDQEGEALVRLCRSNTLPARLPAFDLLTREETHPLVKHNLRLLYGRWLAQHDLFDEAQQVLVGLQPEEVVDPASLLFYQSLVHHALLQKDECLETARRLLENESRLPKRYATVARLVEADMRPLEEDSLDEVARMMRDIRRRLGFGRAGKRVRNEEDEVIAKLDKMIEEMGKKAKQVSTSSQNSGRSSRPAEKSQALGGSGPGDVDQKRIGNTAGWGNLPPKEREQALQQMSKDLPAHFRELIEEYFRKLAQDEDYD